MSKTGWRVTVVVALMSLAVGCTGSGAPVDTTVAAISFANSPNPAGGAGEFYNEVIRFDTAGGAAMPDKFELTQGVLPPGLFLCRDGMEEIGDVFTDEVDGATQSFPLSQVNIHEDAPGLTVLIDNVVQPSNTYVFNGRTVSFFAPPAAGSTVEVRYTVWVCDGGQFTGTARIVGFPREMGSFGFTVKAISTGALAGNLAGVDPDQPDVAVVAAFTITIGEGTINILTPTAAEGTSDPETPAFPEVINFVNPADENAFFAFGFLIAGGTGDNCLNIYMARELELSVFDEAVVSGQALATDDVDESQFSNIDKYRSNIADGGWFVQAGTFQIQVGGFQSPRGTPNLGTGITNLFAEWFQQAPLPARNSRRRASDPDGFAAGDPTLGTPVPIQFSDYFDGRNAAGNPVGPDNYVQPGPTTVPPAGKERAKYPFEADQYANAFFGGLGFNPLVDVTPLKFRIIVEAIDKRNTADKGDDIVARKAFLVQVRIPDIQIDTVVLPQGRAGVLYTEFANSSGGVPPLKFDLEHVDGDTSTVLATDGHALTKALFGLNMEESTGLILGVPRASGEVKLTIRVFADVLNPKQGPASDATPAVPTGTVGEVDGNVTLGGVTKKGRHRTIVVEFLLPFAADIANDTLPTGIDGVPYPRTSLQRAGGVARLVPYPPSQSLTGNLTYNFAQAVENVEFGTPQYAVDTSHPKDADDDGVPDPDALLNINGTVADPNGTNGDNIVAGVPLSGTFNAGPGFVDQLVNGDLFGTFTDRGFHTILFVAVDFYVGPAQVAHATAFRVNFSKQIPLSIAPDAISYLRGSASGESTGLDTDQQGAAAMVPMISRSALVSLQTGAAAEEVDIGTNEIDLIPLLIANGGTDTHNNKGVPSLDGYWPAESGFEDVWIATNSTLQYQQAHMQQEQVCITAPTHHNRCYLYTESFTTKYNSGATTGSWAIRYQQFEPSGERGILMVDSLNGETWVAAKLSNSLSGTNGDGSQFGAEYVHQRGSDRAYGSHGTNYTRYYGYNDLYGSDAPDRNVQLVGLSHYIEQMTVAGSNVGWYSGSLGRAGTSVAVSADGSWAATALPGGTNEQKILVWSLKNEPIPQALLDAGADGVAGCRSDGTAIDDTTTGFQAAIIRLGGQTFDGPGGKLFVLFSNQKNLLPDSLTFVDGGLLFVNHGNYDKIFGIDLVSGALTYMDINLDRIAPPNSTLNPGTGVFVSSSTGQYPPNRDHVQAQMAQQAYAAQFSFAGDKPEPGALGPDTVSFVAGANRTVTDRDDSFDDPDLPRQGYRAQGNRAKSLFAIRIAVTGGGLDLSASTLIDVTGFDPQVTGDFMTPGALGEELNFVALSDDGEYVAAVRDVQINTESASSFSSVNYIPTVGTYGYSSSTFAGSDDVVVASIDGDSLTSGGNQHLIYIGTGNGTVNNGGAATGMPNYAVSRNLVNAQYRRIFDLTWDEDGESLIFKYSGGEYNTAVRGSAWNPKYTGSNVQYCHNPTTTYTSSFKSGLQLLLRVDVRNSNGTLNNWASDTGNTLIQNMLRGLGGTAGIGPSNVNAYGTTETSDQTFWAMFKSPDGRFLYVISDQLGQRNYMIGFNITDVTINGRQPFEPFSPHPSTVGFGWLENNSQNYEPRFAARAGGDQIPVDRRAVFNGRDADGILCLVASDSSAGANSATDLEVYVMDVNIGSDMRVLTSSVTQGGTNAINYLTLSANGNILIFQRASFGGNSATNRTSLTSDNDLCAVLNVHAVVDGNAAPIATILSGGASHGASVALVGEGTAAGPQAVIFSRAADNAGGGGSGTWSERQLFIGVLAVGAPAPIPVDNTRTFYNLIGAGREIADNAFGLD